MLSAADNDVLTRTGPGTPMGDYLTEATRELRMPRDRITAFTRKDHPDD